MDERWKQIDRDEPIPAHIKEKMEECRRKRMILPDEEYGAPLKSQADIKDDDEEETEKENLPDGWTRGSFGILEPTRGFVARPEEIDLVICPCTGFDENLNRLGMGGGFYDRFLPLCKNAKIIAVAYEAQKIPRVRTNAFDVPMDAVVTESNIYKAAGK